MIIEIATICDAATVDNGKLNILGSFDKIFSKSLPSTHPSCAIAIKMKFEKKDKIEKKFKLKILAGDQKEVIPTIEFDLNTNETPKEGEWLSVPLAFSIYNLVLESFGEYKVVVSGEHKKLHEIFFEVAQLK